MTEIDSSLRPSPVPDKQPPTQDDNMSTPRRSILPTDYHDLSPLDVLAAQGRLLNKRLTQHGKKKSSDSTPAAHAFDESVFPKFGVSDAFEDRVFHRHTRHRLPEKRRETEAETDKVDGPKVPSDSLSLPTLTLIATPQPVTSKKSPDLARSESQASSQLSLSTSSDDTETPTETHLTAQIYQPPLKVDPPRLRPIIKTQHLNRPHSPVNSPTSSKDQLTPVDLPATRPFPPQIANSLDRPQIPFLQARGEKLNHNRRTPSINFSRPYSSRSSQYSDASSISEVDSFSGHRASRSTEEHLFVPSPGTESLASSPGLCEEDFKKLPRGRRKSRPVTGTGLFFHSTSMKKLDAAYRWPQTPVTPTNEGERKFFPSPPEDPIPSTSRSLSTRTPPTSSDIPRVRRPSTSGAIIESSRNREIRSPSHEVRRPSVSGSQTFPKYIFHPPSPQEHFNSPTQILNPTSSVTMLLTPSVRTESISPEDHVTLGIKFHQENYLAQSTHHFQLAAEGGCPTGMLLYSLSLRHGWGCAANPEKAVELLHSAAECASAEVDENGVRKPRSGKGLVFKSEDVKRGGATLALAIYELGQSYMHGWGVVKDKYLALRCFEISANFGDTDGQWYSLPT
jgi:hypothetical protein